MEPEDQLVESCRRKDEGAWTKLVQTYRRDVYILCYRFCSRKEEAEDLTQEIFLKVFRAIKGYDRKRASFATWLNHVARNHLVDYYRRTRKDRMTSSLEDGFPWLKEEHRHEENVPDQVERSERRGMLHMALGSLSPGLRQAVILRDLEGLQYMEISEVLGVPPGTAKSRVHRGHLELGRLLNSRRTEQIRSASAMLY